MAAEDPATRLGSQLRTEGSTAPKWSVSSSVGECPVSSVDVDWCEEDAFETESGVSDGSELD